MYRYENVLDEMIDEVISEMIKPIIIEEWRHIIKDHREMQLAEVLT